MAFHGSRNAPRGASRGSSTGGRGRGGRGRGRGGGSSRGRGRLVFDSARLAQEKEGTFDDPSEEESTSEEDIKSGDEDELMNDDEEESAQVTSSYATLLLNLARDSIAAPKSKRRKLVHEDEQEMLEKMDDDASDEAGLQDKDIDRVDESEDGLETATDGILEDDEDNSTPFEAHFANPDDNMLSRKLRFIQQGVWSTYKMSTPLSKTILSLPSDEKPSASTLLPGIPDPTNLKLKQKLLKTVANQKVSFKALEASIVPLVFNYNDVLFCERTHVNSKDLQRMTCLHAVNHIYTTRDRVIKNNARLAQEEINDDLELRDQGFTRPKVLMLLPTRQSCVNMVNMIISLCEPEQQENRKRFDENYVDKDEKFSEDKPADFRDLFSGNDDDMFRLGLKFTRKTIKYFSQFYNSDIIIASPLGLKMAIGTEEKKTDYDFLSSIEIVIVDQADALLMQNWEHVEFIFEHLNLQPKEAHGCDFSRVRSWYLDNNSKGFRQTIALSAFNTPELNTLFYNQSKNWAGKVKINAHYMGTIQELGMKVKQTFSRLDSPSFATDPDMRFNYFKTAIIPTLTRHIKEAAGTVLFIPSYLDFVRVRNYLATSTTASKLSFGTISEYTSVKDVARARSHFLNGRYSVLLYTERAHHFRRYQLRGVKKVVMYGLPDNPIFYKEIVGGYLGRSAQDRILESGEGSMRAIFSKWDVLKLERIAGSERVGKMIKDKGDTFDFL